MIYRFEGEAGRRLRVEALLTQKMVGANRALAEQLADMVRLRSLAAGEMLIEQNGTDNDVFMVLAGALQIIVNGRTVGRRGPNDHVGEMAAIEPTLKRAASVIALEASVVAAISEPQLAELGNTYPELYRCLAKELARRSEQRNAYVNATRDKIRVFIISSAEAREVARTVQNAFERDPFTTVVWTDDVFKVAHYTLQSLEDQVDTCDFAIAITHADDVTESRGQRWPAPRDNVIFELGLFMGRLGKSRAILMEPREEGLKLPSDFAGITTVPYRYEPGPDVAALMAPACNKLRQHILALGPNN
jgi:CRP/FNR family cyclic AMP-dependent transcriptional regulator